MSGDKLNITGNLITRERGATASTMTMLSEQISGVRDNIRADCTASGHELCMKCTAKKLVKHCGT